MEPMADATTRGFCDSCHSEVPAVKNHHRARNMSAANFAAANFGLCSVDPHAMGPTGPYVCAHCGVNVKVTRKRGVPPVVPTHVSEPAPTRLEEGRQ
jgi:hypothetical protein